MNPTQILSDEHQVILRVLACVERVVAKDEPLPREDLTRAIDFYRSYADACHHGKEEALLFPAMEMRGMSEHQGPTAVMRDEHEFGRALIGRMANALADQDEAGDATFRRVAVQHVEFLRSHIAKEDGVLFPMAQRMLTHSQVTELGERFAAVESAEFGPDFHARYESWANELAERLGVQKERYVPPTACGGDAPASDHP